MFQDRRRHLRNTVLLKASAVTDRERLDVVCTNIGPSGGFFTSRRQPAIGERLTIELRPGGLNSAAIEMLAITVRTTPAGSSWPAGFAVLWSSARCGLGPVPLLRILTEVLRLDGVQLSDIVSTDLATSFDIEAWQRGMRAPAGDAIGGRSRASSGMHRMQGSRPSPLTHASASSALDDKAPERIGHRSSSTTVPAASFVRPLSHSSGAAVAAAPEAERTFSPSLPQPAPRQSSTIQAAAAPTRPLAAAPRIGVAESGRHVAAPSAVIEPVARSVAAPYIYADSEILGFDEPLDGDKTPVGGPPGDMGFDGAPSEPTDASRTPLQIEASPPIGQRSSAAATDDSYSQSWPIWALGAGERRAVTGSGFAIGGSAAREDTGLTPLRTMGARAPQISGARAVPVQADVVAPMASGRTPGPGLSSGSYHAQRPISDVVARPASGMAATPLPGLARPVPADKSTVRRPANADPRAMRAADVPVTFLRKNQFVPGRMVALAQALVAIITEDTPPEMDEALLINVPVLVEGLYRTVYLEGKLTQVPQDAEHGKRFVMHIERVDEGKCKGAFRNFVDSLALD